MILLGQGRVAGTGAGNKAALLDRAARAGLPVPPAVFLPHAAPLPKPPFSGPYAVRSAFSLEDQPGRSLAGHFLTELNVDPAGLVDSVARVRASAARLAAESPRRDILIMSMVQPHTAGVAFLERDYLDDLVNWTPGLGAALVSGEVPGESLLLARRGIAHPGVLHPWQRRLRRMIARVRREFGDLDWDIEWADDGARCWLLQIRPITAPPRRNETFTLANHKEILPDLPSHLMTSVIAEASPALFSYYRSFDPSLPQRRPFIEVFAGRPLINISLMSDLMRHWGLPTSLVTGNIGGTTDRPAPLYLPRMLARLLPLLRMALAQLGAGQEARRLLRRIEDETAPAPATFTEAVAQLRLAYSLLVRGMFALTAAMSAPLALLRRCGVLQEWSARLQTPGSQMLEELAALASDGAGPDSPRWQEFLSRHGHRGIYESDIARPRFREQAGLLAGALQSAEPRQRQRTRLSWEAWITWPVWLQARRSMLAREQFRSGTMHAFERIRLAMLALAQGAGLEPESLWLLSADEARRLDCGWRPDARFLEARLAERRHWARLTLPGLVRRFDDLEQAAARQASSTRFTGISLTKGTVRGRAWVLREPSLQRPPGWTAAETILVAPAVDAGWIPTFLQAAGVAVETGGDLSHGSIILRECGIPAVTNLGPLSASLTTGDWIELRASAGVVEIVPAPAPVGQG